MSCFAQDVPFLPARLQRCEGGILSFVLAAKGLLDETTTVLEEIMTDLMTGKGECMQRVQVDVGGDLDDDADQD